MKSLYTFSSSSCSSLIAYCRPLFSFSSHKLYSSSSHDHVHVVDGLLARRNHPLSALAYFIKSVDKKRGFVPEIRDPFCVLLHILVSSRDLHNVAESFLDSYLSNEYSSPSSGVAGLVDNLVNSSQRFGFRMKPPIVFDYVLIGYVRAQRYVDAKNCYYSMVSRGIAPSPMTLNTFLHSLIYDAKMFDEARYLFWDVVSKKITYDCGTVYMMMCFSLTENNVEEAEKWFLVAKNCGIRLDARVYSTAICICVKRRNMVEAHRLTDEMISRGHSMHLVVATSLLKGYCELGYLERALDLFDEIVEDDLFPNEIIYEVMIEGCCVDLEIEVAIALMEEMRDRGLVPSEHAFTSVICACVEDGNIVAAHNMKEDMISAGHSVNNVVYGRLRAGYWMDNDHDLESYSDLSDSYDDD